MNFLPLVSSKNVTLYTSLPLPLSPSFFLDINTFSKDCESGGKHEKEWIGEGSYLRLIYGFGDKAASLIDYLCLHATETKRKNKPGSSYKIALASLISNLLQVRHSHTYSYGYHQLRPEAFWRLQVGYTSFVSMMNGLVEHGYVAKQKGYKEHTGKNAKAVASRFRATDKLINLAADYGITPANWKVHFPRLPRPIAIPRPIILKSESTYCGKGKRMFVDRYDPIIKKLTAPMDELNAFMHKQVIVPDNQYAFTRNFAHGDRKNHAFRHGARIYSVGEDNYQQKSGYERSLMTINGEAVVELDVKCSHLTILHALAKVPIPNNPDPYSIAGYERDAVKTFVTMTLGYDKFHQDWTKDAHLAYAKGRKKKRLPPVELPPYAEVKAAALRALPLLQQWPDRKETRWGDLQWIESEVILDTLLRLKRAYSVVALPVHDSIIVPASQKVVAENALSEAFYRRIGVYPFIECKKPVPPLS